MNRINRLMVYLILLMFTGPLLRAQTVFDYGNSWYNPASTYFKMLVTADGIYRVTQADLLTAGVNLSGLNANNLHVIYRGREIPVYVDATGGFSYLEFYGRRNDGKVDSMLYKSPATHLADPAQQAAPRSSLFSDTSAYFVTWDATPGLRYTNFTDADYTSWPPQSSFPYQVHLDFPTYYLDNFYSETGERDPNNPFYHLNSNYITGEGYTGQIVVTDVYSPVLSFATPRHAGGQVDASLRIFAGESGSHQFDLTLNSTTLGADTSTGINIHDVVKSITTSLSSTTSLKIACTRPLDEARITWAAIRYQRSMNLDNADNMQVSGWLSSAVKTNFTFTNAAATAKAVMYDVTAGYRIPAKVISSTTLQFLVPGDPAARDLLLITDTGFRTPVIRKTSSLANLSDVSGGVDFFIITHRSLRQSAEAYKAYRDTCTVNPLTARIVYVDEIYDEFGYGTITPWAIKRFCKYAIDEYTHPARYFVLWGKGQELTRDAPVNLVPTFGSPPSDAEYVSDFDFSVIDVVPHASIGRISVTADQEGYDYIAKLNEFEHTPFAPWMKDGVMLGGGTNNSEQYNIDQALLAESAPWFEGKPLGGYIRHWQRKGSVIVSNTTLSVADAIGRGASLIHFFGHSTENVFDIDIQGADQYNNWGKYPFMIAMGCYGGDFTTDHASFGERFLLEPGRGSIGYLANTTAGVLSSLREYSYHLYQNLYNGSVDSPLGDGLERAAYDYAYKGGSHTRNIYVLNQIKQLGLQGDPSIHLNIPAKPDVAVTAADLWFESGSINVDQDTFLLHVIIHDYGKVTGDSLAVTLTHRLPGGSAFLTYDTLIGPVRYADTLTWAIPNLVGDALAGLNQFEIALDGPDSLDEYSESNNIALLLEYVQSNAPGLILPYDFSVIPVDTVTLVASQQQITTSTTVPYLFEIDTTYYFASPAKVSSPLVSGTSARGSWKVPFTLSENVVYYWRARFADVSPPVWNNGSFRYRSGQTGWSQIRPEQMLKNPSSGMKITAQDPRWSFSPWYKVLHAFVKGQLPDYFLGSFRSSFATNANGVSYTPITYKDLVPSIQNVAQGDWRFSSMPDGQADIVNVIGQMKRGDYFLMASNRSPLISQWNAGMLNALEQVGVNRDRLSGLADNNPIVLIGRKGYPGSAIVVTSPNVVGSDSIPQYDINTNLYTTYYEGTVQSNGAGPALGYTSLDWAWESLDALPDETATLDVYGIKPDQSTDLLFDDLVRGSYSLTAVDAATYPALQLIATVKDEVQFTPPQLTGWSVLYTPSPEAALDPSVLYYFSADTVDEGNDITMRIAARNLTAVDMDSMLVKAWLENADRSRIELGSRRFADLPGNSWDTLSWTFNTRNLGGTVVFSLEMNPAGDQPEQYHFNNLFSRAFFVRADNSPPLMDVTVDGKHLMEGDIVAPSPEITIMVKDENPYLPLTVADSTYVIYFGKGRLEEQWTRVHVQGNPSVESVPAILPENRSRIVYRPGPLEDGEYTLRVSAADVKGNPSGKDAYEIHFNVVNENSITRVLPYPNPFSSSCRWAYLLTGSEIPYRFELEIYTISGHLVRRINLAEEEQIRTGYNITTYAWDGTDEYGDQLANGVYIYKVLVKFHDRFTRISNPGSDRYFSNDFGKLYLMR